MHVHGRKISNCALPPSHMEGLRLPTRIDSVRLRLHPFDYDFMHPSNYIKPSELRRKLSELSSKPSELSRETSELPSEPSTHMATRRLFHSIVQKTQHPVIYHRLITPQLSPSHALRACMHTYEGCKPTRADNELSHVSIFRLSILRVVCFYICFMIIHSFHGGGTGSILRSRRAGGKTLSVGDHDDAKLAQKDGFARTRRRQCTGRTSSYVRLLPSRLSYQASHVELSASRPNNIHLLGHDDDDPSPPTS
jgi:hypothetical protein